MSLMDTMNQRAMELGVPFAVHFDVTYRCNERCIHCYLDHDDHGEMTTSEIKGLLDQIAEAGTFLLTFSGGEIFMRRDIFELLEYARRLLFNVKIKTNAVMIRQAEAERLLRLGIDQIQISIYSHRPQVHDFITKLPGALKRSLEAIRFLKSHGLNVVIANVMMKSNMADRAGVQALARELGVPYTLDPTITPKMDGDTSILNLRIPESELTLCFMMKIWLETWRSIARLLCRPAQTIWTDIPAAPGIRSPISLHTAMFFPACNFPCPAEMCGGRSSLISGGIRPSSQKCDPFTPETYLSAPLAHTWLAAAAALAWPTWKAICEDPRRRTARNLSSVLALLPRTCSVTADFRLEQTLFRSSPCRPKRYRFRA